MSIPINSTSNNSPLTDQLITFFKNLIDYASENFTDLGIPFSVVARRKIYRQIQQNYSFLLPIAEYIFRIFIILKTKQPFPVLPKQFFGDNKQLLQEFGNTVLIPAYKKEIYLAHFGHKLALDIAPRSYNKWFTRTLTDVYNWAATIAIVSDRLIRIENDIFTMYVENVPDLLEIRAPTLNTIFLTKHQQYLSIKEVIEGIFESKITYANITNEQFNNFIYVYRYQYQSRLQSSPLNNLPTPIPPVILNHLIFVDNPLHSAFQTLPTYISTVLNKMELSNNHYTERVEHFVKKIQSAFSEYNDDYREAVWEILAKIYLSQKGKIRPLTAFETTNFNFSSKFKAGRYSKEIYSDILNILTILEQYYLIDINPLHADISEKFQSYYITDFFNAKDMHYIYPKIKQVYQYIKTKTKQVQDFIGKNTNLLEIRKFIDRVHLDLHGFNDVLNANYNNNIIVDFFNTYTSIFGVTDYGMYYNKIFGVELPFLSDGSQLPIKNNDFYELIKSQRELKAEPIDNDIGNTILAAEHVLINKNSIDPDNYPNTIDSELKERIIFNYKISDMETIINLAKMLFVASHNHTTLRPSSRYHSTNIKGRVIEVVEKFGDYIKSINNNTVLLTTNTRTIAYIKLKKNNLLINEQILNDLIANQIIVAKIFENKDYYCIQGQLIPFESSSSKIFNSSINNKIELSIDMKEKYDTNKIRILQSLAMHSNGIGVSDLSTQVRISITELKLFLNLLIDEDIILVDTFTNNYYIPSFEERVFTELSINHGLLDKKLFSIKLQKILDILEKNELFKYIRLDKDSNFNTKIEIALEENIDNVLELLTKTGYIEYDNDKGSFNLLTKKYNKYIGLTPFETNNKSLPLNIENYVDTLYNNYLNNKSLIYITDLLSMILNNYNSDNITLIDSLVPNINITYKTILRYLHNMNSAGLINMFYGPPTNRIYSDINPIYLEVIQKLIDKVHDSTLFDFALGTIEIHILPLYIIQIILDHKNETKPFNYSGLINSFSSLPEIKFIQSCLKSIDLDITVERLLGKYLLKNIEFNLDDVFYSNFFNAILSSGNRDSKSPYGIHAGTITIDLRMFKEKNKNNSYNAFKDLILVLTRNNTTLMHSLIAELQNKFVLPINAQSTEPHIIAFMQTFWEIFHQIIYGNNPVEFLENIKYVLYYIDGAITITNNTMIVDTNNNIIVDSTKKSINTKYYKMLIKDVSISSTNDDIIVPKIKTKLLDHLISSLSACFVGKSLALGHPLTFGDRTGSDANTHRFLRIGGHSDIAYQYPPAWVHLTKFITRVYGDNTWWAVKKVDTKYKLVSGIADIEYKNSSTRYGVKFSQVQYLFGTPNPDASPSDELRKKQGNDNSNTPVLTNQAITKMILSPYIGNIKISSDIFLSLCYDILKLLNGKNKSLISYSRPITMKRYKYSACNTVILNFIHLRNYLVIDALQKSLQLIYFGRSDLHDISNLFTTLGLKVDESRSSPTEFYIESISETVLTDIINEIQSPKSKLITACLNV